MTTYETHADENGEADGEKGSLKEQEKMTSELIIEGAKGDERNVDRDRERQGNYVLYFMIVFRPSTIFELTFYHFTGKTCV